MNLGKQAQHLITFNTLTPGSINIASELGNDPNLVNTDLCSQASGLESGTASGGDISGMTIL